MKHTCAEAVPSASRPEPISSHRSQILPPPPLRKELSDNFLAAEQLEMKTFVRTFFCFFVAPQDFKIAATRTSSTLGTYGVKDTTQSKLHFFRANIIYSLFFCIGTYGLNANTYFDRSILRYLLAF